MIPLLQPLQPAIDQRGELNVYTALVLLFLEILLLCLLVIQTRTRIIRPRPRSWHSPALMLYLPIPITGGVLYLLNIWGFVEGWRSPLFLLANVTFTWNSIGPVRSRVFSAAAGGLVLGGFLLAGPRPYALGNAWAWLASTGGFIWCSGTLLAAVAYETLYRMPHAPHKPVPCRTWHAFNLAVYFAVNVWANTYIDPGDWQRANLVKLLVHCGNAVAWVWLFRPQPSSLV